MQQFRESGTRSEGVSPAEHDSGGKKEESQEEISDASFNRELLENLLEHTHNARTIISYVANWRAELWTHEEPTNELPPDFEYLAKSLDGVAGEFSTLELNEDQQKLLVRTLAGLYDRVTYGQKKFDKANPGQDDIDLPNTINMASLQIYSFLKSIENSVRH